MCDWCCQLSSVLWSRGWVGNCCPSDWYVGDARQAGSSSMRFTAAATKYFTKPRVSLILCTCVIVLLTFSVQVECNGGNRYTTTYNCGIPGILTCVVYITICITHCYTWPLRHILLYILCCFSHLRVDSICCCIWPWLMQVLVMCHLSNFSS